ncbi:MAG: UDP-N-acetylmuramate dehydrogenase, partial [Patescibacteria group bacterium]
MANMNILENVPLAPLTTMGVGGPARYFVEVKSEDEAREALKFASGKDLPVFVLGGGSNIIIADSGLPGLVIKNGITGFEVQNLGDKVRVEVGAGENWDEFVKRTVEMGFAGVENLSGVPGTVGSAPVQNIGCYGQSAEETIREVRAFHIKTGEPRIFSGADCEFSYRDSIFRSKESGRYFITEVVFELIPGGKANVSSYQDVEKYFADWNRTPSLIEMRQALLTIRARKGMVVLLGYETYQSVGSFFKNPVISAEDFVRVRAMVEKPAFTEFRRGEVERPASAKAEVSTKIGRPTS